MTDSPLFTKLANRNRLGKRKSPEDAPTTSSIDSPDASLEKKRGAEEDHGMSDDHDLPQPLSHHQNHPGIHFHVEHPSQEADDEDPDDDPPSDPDSDDPGGSPRSKKTNKNPPTAKRAKKGSGAFPSASPPGFPSFQDPYSAPASFNEVKVDNERGNGDLDPAEEEYDDDAIGDTPPLGLQLKSQADNDRVSQIISSAQTSLLNGGVAPMGPAISLATDESVVPLWIKQPYSETVGRHLKHTEGAAMDLRGPNGLSVHHPSNFLNQLPTWKGMTIGDFEDLFHQTYEQFQKLLARQNDRLQWYASMFGMWDAERGVIQILDYGQLQSTYNHFHELLHYTFVEGVKNFNLETELTPRNKTYLTETIEMMDFLWRRRLLPPPRGLLPTPRCHPTRLGLGGLRELVQG